MKQLLKYLKPDHFDYRSESTHVLTTLYGILCPKTNIDIHLKIAKSLELLKSSTLIIDDILDKSPKRNGIKSLYKEIGIGRAILIGEILKSQSSREIANLINKISPNNLYRIVELLESTYTLICQGQLDDLEFEKIPIKQISIENYFNMIEKTSAHFISLPGIIALILGNRKEEEIDKINKFGVNIGFAYQIRDDILDIIGDQEYIGKAEQMDLRRKKKRLPLLIAYKYCNKKDKLKFDRIFSKKGNLDMTDMSYILNIIKDTKALKTANSILNKFKAEALQNLRGWNEPKELKQLTALADLLANFQSLPYEITNYYEMII